MAWPKLRSRKSPGRLVTQSSHSGAAPDGAQSYGAAPNGAALAIINREPTGMDSQADVVIHAEIGAVLREIVP